MFIDYNISNIGHYIIRVCVCVYTSHIYMEFTKMGCSGHTYSFFKDKNEKDKEAYHIHHATHHETNVPSVIISHI